MSSLLVIALGLAAILMMCLVLRSTDRRAKQRCDAIIRSPVIQALTVGAARVVVRTVIALDDEMLIELWSAPARHDQPMRQTSPPNEQALWVHSAANVASIITLTRWRDARTVVDVRGQPCGVVLANDHARVSLARARADLVL
jgi:hypothetical protein